LGSKKQYPLIDYTSRDFNSIKEDLVDYAKRYYPNSFKDFSESGFGPLMLDTTAYIGDILSFYLDYSVNESFLDTAIEYDNVIKLGRQMGYRFNPAASSVGEAIFYIIIPAVTVGTGPDTNYMPILKRGTEVSSIDNLGFILNEDVDFSDPNNELVIAEVNSTTGAVISYAIRARGQVVSGRINRESLVVGGFQKFLKLKLSADNITDVMSVVDSEGNEYYEVDYLSQDTIYKPTLNRGDNSSVTQNLLRPFVVPRRFVLERTQEDAFLQFGFGTKNTTLAVDSVVDPSKVVLKVHGKDYISDTSIDPGNFLKTDKFGVAPSNTTLTVIYRVNDSDNINISANSLTNIDTPLWDFKELSSLSSTALSSVVSSLEINNDQPIIGDVTLPTTEELKHRIYNVFSSQNRAVTSEDYRSLCYSMPSKYGAVKRVNIIRDSTSLRRNLNLYVLSEANDGTLAISNSTIKENLKQWLSQSKMISDTIDILDAKIINIGIEFSAIAALDTNKFDVLSAAVSKLAAYYASKFEIGQPFYVSDIYTQLNKMKGVIDVTKVKIVQKSGLNYASNPVDINMLYSADGSYIDCPKNVIFEIKYPDIDIKGTIK
tara:strand:+ start:12223 stop:14025 length:1803 start_codon:yes stop_codon:yes gene_type:complete